MIKMKGIRYLKRILCVVVVACLLTAVVIPVAATELDDLLKEAINPSASDYETMEEVNRKLWNAFFEDPEAFIKVFAKQKTENIRTLHEHMSWPNKGDFSESTVIAARNTVNAFLDKEPNKTEEQIAYRFLMEMDFLVDYETDTDNWTVRDYLRLFKKWGYADGAYSTSCRYQLVEVFLKTPAEFVKALALWSQTASKDRGIDTIATGMGYTVYEQQNEEYQSILENLKNTLTDELEKQSVAALMLAYQKIVNPTEETEPTAEATTEPIQTVATEAATIPPTVSTTAPAEDLSTEQPTYETQPLPSAQEEKDNPIPGWVWIVSAASLLVACALWLKKVSVYSC